MGNIPADVVGIIVDFLSESGTEAFLAGLVNSMWMQGVEGADELWDRLTFEQWGGRKRRGGFPMYRARMTAALAYRPLELQHLHAIEDCDSAFKCPLVAEALKPTGRTSENGNPILHCAVCNEDVCVVSCYESCRNCRRVMAKPQQDFLGDRPCGSAPVVLYSEDPSFSQRVLSTLRREFKQTVYGDVDYTINFDETIVGQSGIDLIHFVDQLPREESPQKHLSCVFYQGSQAPPDSITGGIPAGLVVKVNSVHEAAEKISRMIEHAGDMVFGFL